MPQRWLGGHIHLRIALLQTVVEPALRILILGLLYYVVASVALNAFVSTWQMGNLWDDTEFRRVVAFDTPRPFVYRVLTPLVIRSVSAVLPPLAADVLSARSEILRARYDVGHEPELELEYAVAYYLLFACLVGAMLVWRSSIASAFGAAGWISDLTPVLAMLLYPMTFVRGGYLYDAPELFLSSACFLAFLKRRWWLFYGLFALAVLNKESAIVLPVWFLGAFMGDRDLRSLVKRGSLSAAIGMAIIVAARLAFAGQPGEPFEWNLVQNVHFLLTPRSYTYVFDAYAAALPVPLGLNLVNLAILGCLLVATFNRVPALIFRSFLLTVAAIVPLWILFGFEDELRVFAAAFAPLTLLFAAWLRSVTNSEALRDRYQDKYQVRRS